MKLRKGDTVEVLTGKDKGKQGTILQVLPSEEKVIVSGVNTASKHMKPGRRHRNRQAPQQRDQGGIVDIDLPIPASNVALRPRRQARPHRLQHRRQGQQGARRQARRRQDRGHRMNQNRCERLSASEGAVNNGLRDRGTQWTVSDD